jgi:hypothetical protein
MKQWWNDNQHGKTEKLGEKPAAMPLYPLQISL